MMYDFYWKHVIFIKHGRFDKYVLDKIIRMRQEELEKEKHRSYKLSRITYSSGSYVTSDKEYVLNDIFGKLYQ